MRLVDFVDGGRQRLASMNGAVWSGLEVDFTPPLLPKGLPEWEKDDHRQVLVASMYERCEMQHLNDWLRFFEDAKRLKYGTFSRRAPFIWKGISGTEQSLRDQVRLYFDARRSLPRFDEDARAYANQFVMGLLDPGRHGKLLPIHVEDASQRFDKTGLGYPVMSSDQEKWHETVLQISREIWESDCNPSWVVQLPALCGFRGQNRGPEWYSKTRLIYMMPRALANLEKCIQAPLFDALRTAPTFCAWNTSRDVDQEMTRLLRQERRILSVDFKRFDTSVPFEVVDEIYTIIRRWFSPLARPLVDFCHEVMRRSGIICPNEEFFGEERSGGVPSGCVMTNLTDSLINLWVMAYAAFRCKSGIQSMYSQGDDAAVTFTSDVALSDLAAELSHSFGMTLADDKTTYEVGRVHFLQNVHSVHHVVDGLNVGIRPIMQVMPAMLAYERVDQDDWVREFDTIRWIQQISMALHHPSATQACDWLYDHDRDVLQEVVRELMTNGPWLRRACKAVSKKQSNGFYSFSPKEFLASPVVQYLTSRCQ